MFEGVIGIWTSSIIFKMYGIPYKLWNFVAICFIFPGIGL